MGKLRIFVLVLVSFCFVASVSAEEGLVAYYSFDEGSGEEVLDESGKNNHATLIGGVTWVEGKFGQALEFDGEKSGLNCGNPVDGSFNVGDGDFTVSMWIKTVQTGEQISLIIKAGGSGSPFWLFGINKGELRARIHDGICCAAHGPNPPPDNIVLNDGAWHHVAFVVNRDYAIIYMYVDGKRDFRFGISEITGKLDNTRWLAIGFDWVNRFKGAIDEVRIYKRALDAEEVKQDFQGIYK